MIDHARLLANDRAVLYHDEIGNAHHIEPPCKIRPSFGIDFEHDSMTGHFRGDALHFRCSHAAWSAPGGPKVDEYGDSCRRYNFVEASSIHVDWFSDRR